MTDFDAILAALRYQRDGINTSPMYQHLLSAVIDDADAGGICRDVLARTPEDVEPVLDALALRFLGGLHRLVLDGYAPELANHYPSVGGRFDAESPELAPVLLQTIADHRDRMADALTRSVQTNEVGRCASLLPGFLHIAAATGLPLRVLEIGASGGLNLRWDRYHYTGGADGSTFGDASSPLHFSDVYEEPLPQLDIDARVVERRGCDRNPIDPATSEGAQLLRSFVWPDQRERFAALDAAISLAPAVAAPVDEIDAGDWVRDQLQAPSDGVATVIFQSIVWQYLSPPTRAALDQTIRSAGQDCTPDSPVAWLRMEPGGDPSKGAEVRLSMWPGPEKRLIAVSGYHGRPVRLCD